MWLTIATCECQYFILPTFPTFWSWKINRKGLTIKKSNSVYENVTSWVPSKALGLLFHNNLPALSKQLDWISSALVFPTQPFCSSSKTFRVFGQNQIDPTKTVRSNAMQCSDDYYTQAPFHPLTVTLCKELGNSCLHFHDLRLKKSRI